MKPVSIDFAAPSLMRTVWLTSPVTWLMCALGLGLCCAVALRALDLKQQHQTLRDRLQLTYTTLAAQRARVEPSGVRAFTEPATVAVNAAVSQLNLPWRQLFMAIEAATPSTIALVSLEPDAKARLLRGWAEARTSDEMVTYIGKLGEQSFLQDVTLVRHETNLQDTNRPFRFQFEARWGGAVP